MKPRYTIPTLLLLAVMLAGCATFQSNAGKSLVTIAQTVDAAMKGWATYAVASGTVTDADHAKVRDAYLKYQACMVTAQAAYQGLAAASDKSAWNQALNALTASQASLLQLLQAFTAAQAAKPQAIFMPPAAPINPQFPTGEWHLL